MFFKKVVKLRNLNNLPINLISEHAGIVEKNENNTETLMQPQL